MKNLRKFLFWSLILSFAFCIQSCNDEDSSTNSKSIVGTWAEDTNTSYSQSYWTFKSNGEFESHLYQSGDQPRYGTYILNSGILTIKIRAIEGNNGAYTRQYVVTTLTNNSLVLVSDDEVRSFTRKE